MSHALDVFDTTEPVTRYRRGPTTRDDAGDQKAGAWAATDLPRASIVPGTATEDTTTGFAQLDTTATLYGDPDLDLLPSDEVAWRGVRWQVVGEVAHWADPLSAGTGTTTAELRRRQG